MSERTSSFALFCLGAGLFLAGYVGMAATRPGFPLLFEALTLLFGLPYVARELWRRTNWLAVGYFLLVVPACHRAAMETAGRRIRADRHLSGLANPLWLVPVAPDSSFAAEGRRAPLRCRGLPAIGRP